MGIFDGGYLFTQTRPIKRHGKRAAFWRWLGKLLHSDAIYQRGMRDWTVQDEIYNMVEDYVILNGDGSTPPTMGVIKA